VSISNTLAEIRGCGVKLWFEGDRIRFRAPKGVLQPEHRTWLAENRDKVLAALLEEARSQSVTYRLSFGQEALWLIQQQAPTSPAYNISAPARIHGEVVQKAMHDAVQELMDRHPALRSTYGNEGGELRLTVAGWAPAPLEVRSASGLSESELRLLVEDEAARPFDLATGPLLRVVIFTRAADDHVLLMTAHHIATDGWSLLTLFDDLTKLYHEYTGGPEASLQPQKSDYATFVEWQQDLIQGPEGERLSTYWRSRLASPREPLRLPVDRPSPPVPSYVGGSAAIPFPPQVKERLEELGSRLGVTPFVIWLATFKAFLAHSTGCRDIIVGTPTFGRNRADFMQVVGNFVNSVPIRSLIDENESLESLAASLRVSVMEALDAQELPFARLVQLLHHSRAPGEGPLFRVFFALQRFDQFKQIQTLLAAMPDAAPLTMRGLELTPFPLAQRGAQFDLSLQMVEAQDGVTGAFLYSADVFDHATVEKLARDFAAFCDEIAVHPSQALRSIRSSSTDSSEPEADLEALLSRLAEADVQVTAVDGKLKLNAPKGALDEALRAEIVAMRDRLLDYLQRRHQSFARGITRIPRTDRLPLSAAQRRFWFNTQLHLDGSHYNVGCAVSLSGPLDVSLLRSAIDAAVRRHEALRTTIGELDGEPYARIHPAEDGNIGLIVIDVGSHDEARVQAGRALREPFDIAASPPVRFHLLSIAPQEHVLIVCLHHIIADGWSISILLEDLLHLYEAGLQSSAPRLRQIPFGAVDHAAWENRQTATGGWDKEIAFWRHQLAGAPAVLELPSDRPRPAKASFRGKRIYRYLEKDLVDRLQTFAQGHGATLFMSMLAAWSALLHRLSGQDDILVGTPIADREGLGLDGTLGCFINTVPVRVRFDGAPTFADILTQTRRSTVTAIDNASVPFDVLVAALNPDRGSNHAPIFQVLFTSLNFPSPVQRSSGLTSDLIELDLEVARFDLTVEVAEMRYGSHAGQSLVMYEYATDLFDAETIERLHDHYCTLIAAVVADPRQPLQALPLLDVDQERGLVESWNDTYADHDRSLCAHQLVEMAAASSPDSIAIVASEERLTYAELDHGANRLARLLSERGVARGMRVALCLDRTAQMPLAALAILKAGAAYVPLDPGHPADRLRYIIQDAGAACVITLERFAGLFGDTPAIMLDRDSVAIEKQSSDPLVSGVSPADLAYLIYTSGSTGRPKGVEVEHRNLVAFLDAMRREPGLGREDTVLAVTTLSFDIAGLELWLPLSNGARVVIATREEAIDGARLAALINDHGITLLQATPATWRLLLDGNWTGKRDLVALCGGEAMPRTLAQALLPRVAALWNMYGPTETTIWSTAARVIDAGGPIGIGHPIANTRTYVLDGSARVAPIGVVGELVIAGEGVARGYHEREDLTSRAFATVSIAGRDERIYRTGDLARLRSDGSLDYLGRRDQQVKVRGYRIELGEIEAVLAAHPGVAGAVAAVKTVSPGDDRLVAYTTLLPGHRLDPDALRSTLRSRLPEYMVPSHFVSIPVLPLTPNGKLDRSALPMPSAEASPSAAKPAVPMTGPQRRLADIWASILQTDRVGLFDNFFDIGGHSLLLVKLHAAICSEFKRDLPLVELFQHTTVASQAERLNSNASGTADLIERAKARARRHA
jgi:amino acid adenylation domain-containing protein